MPTVTRAHPPRRDIIKATLCALGVTAFCVHQMPPGGFGAFLLGVLGIGSALIAVGGSVAALRPSLVASEVTLDGRTLAARGPSFRRYTLSIDDVREVTLVVHDLGEIDEYELLLRYGRKRARLLDHEVTGTGILDLIQTWPGFRRDALLALLNRAPKGLEHVWGRRTIIWRSG